MSPKPTYDLSSQAFKACPYHTYTQLRQEAPVYPHTMPTVAGPR